MERVGGSRYQPIRSFTPEIAYEDFYPTYDWAKDSDGHILLIELPGFTKEDVKVQLDNFGNVTVGGERRVSENRCRRFKQVFGVPGDVNYETISARFDSGLLYIIMPKVLQTIKEERDSSDGRGKAEPKQNQEDNGKRTEETSEGKTGEQGRTKEEKRDGAGGNGQRKKEKRETIEREGETTGENREKVGGKGERKEERRQTMEREGETKDGKREKVGGKGEAKEEKRLKFGGEQTIEERTETQEYVDKERELRAKGEKMRNKEEKAEEVSEKISGKGGKNEEVGAERGVIKEGQRERVGGEQGVKEGRSVRGGREIGGGAEREEVKEVRKVQERGNGSGDRERERVVRRERKRENVEGSFEREGGSEEVMGLRRKIWDRVGWGRALESEMVTEMVAITRRNKVAVASILVALSVGLYLSNRIKSADD